MKRKQVGIKLIHGDCLEVMREMDDNSVHLIATDPPYFKVKGEAWDRQWDKPGGFLSWMGELCEQWQRILVPNGSLYVFASPRMAARVECKIAERFAVLENITWVKPDPSCGLNMGAGRGGHACKERLRSWFPRTEEIIFAAHYGADNMAKGETGYVAKCDELRGFVFEPLRAYLDGERKRAGFTLQRIQEAWCAKTGTKGRMAGHWMRRPQWALPTAENYAWLRDLFNADRNGEYLRREYEDLRREYEDLQRPFAVTADVPYTDVWTFPTVQAYKGKHPCEKPVAMMEHIVTASSREGDTVLDCFMGSGTTGVACLNTGRKFIGIEKEAYYMAIARARLKGQRRKKTQRRLL